MTGPDPGPDSHPGPDPGPAGDAGGATYCGHCGDPLADVDHTDCALRLRLEPPRYCARCRRRMKVQVSPRGWSAECVEHGPLGG